MQAAIGCAVALLGLHGLRTKRRQLQARLVQLSPTPTALAAAGRQDSLVTVKIKHPRVHADHDTTMTPDVGPAVAPTAQSVSLLQLAGKSDRPTVDIGPH